MVVHHLKILPEYFGPLLQGDKTFEIRRNDRQFKVGDVVFLKEWDSDTRTFTGRSVIRKIRYITDYEQKPGYVVFSLK